MLYEIPDEQAITRRMNLTGKTFSEAKESILQERYGAPPEGFMLWEDFLSEPSDPYAENLNE